MTTSSAANTRDRDTDVLARFDDERGAGGEPSPQGDLVREYSPDGSECRVVYSSCPVERIEDIIRDEMLRAESCQYTLEWKVYAHDTPSSLRSYLLRAGFEPDAVESVLVLSVTQEAVAAFEAPDFEIRRIYDVEGLSDVAAISRQIGRQDVEEEKQRLAALLRDTPEELSVHVAYVDGEPVACGRTHFKPNSDFAELAGGRTKTTHRSRGLFTALVAARLREALARKRTHMFVDALPTSEPILRKRGFQLVTHTQPFVYRPSPPTQQTDR